MFFKVTSKKITQWEESGNVEKLIKVLQNKDTELRRQAISALGRLGSISAAQPLILLKQDPDVQQQVSKSLEKIATNVFQILGSVASQPTNEQETGLLELLRAIGRPAMRAGQPELFNPNARARLIALELLGKFKNVKSTRYVIDRLSDTDPAVRQTALQVLQRYGPGVVQPVLDAMIHDEKVVFTAVAADSIRQLAQAPKDESAAVDFYISLGDFDRAAEYGEKAAPSLVGLLDHHDPDVRQTALQTLINVGSQAIPVLTEAVRSREPEMRAGALLALSWMDAPRVDELLIKKLSDSHLVSTAARQGLENRKDQAILYFEEQLDAQNKKIIPTVVDVFREMGWEPKTKRQRITTALIYQDWDALIEEGTDAVTPLINYLETIPVKDKYRLEAVLDVLGRIADPKALPVVIHQIRTGEWETVREKAILAAAELVDDQSVLQLESCLGEPDGPLRVFIANVLADNGQPQWREAVEGEPGDLIALARMGNDAAVAGLIHIAGEGEPAAAKNAAADLVLLAKENPAMLVKNWKHIHGILTSPHTDSHSDIDYNRSSDCTHNDAHSDFGLGLDFPDEPPNDRTPGPRDF